MTEWWIGSGGYVKCALKVPEDWRSAMIVSLYKDKGERTECKNYRGINLLSVVGKIYVWILVDRVCKVSKGLNDDEQRGG